MIHIVQKLQNRYPEKTKLDVAKTTFYTIFALVCVCWFFYEAYRLTTDYLSGPVTSIVHSELLNISKYGTLYMCCKASSCFGKGRNNPPGVNFARGYWIRHTFKLGDPDQLRAKRNETNGYPTYERMRAEMRQSGISDVQKFLEHKSEIRYIMEEVDFSEYGMRVFDGTKLWMPKGLMSPFNSKPNRVCFPVPTMSIGHHAGRYGTRKISDQKYTLFTGNEVTFAVNTPPTYIYYLSFYTGKQWYFIENAAYFKFMMRPEPNVTWGIYFAVSIKKTTQIANKDKSFHGLTSEGKEKTLCTMPDEDHDSRYPGLFARYKCEQECEDQVYRQLYGCSWIYMLNGTNQGSSNYTFCNHWVHGPKNDKEIAERTAAWQKCEEERQCYNQKHCEAWDIAIHLTASRGPGHSGSQYKGNFVRFKFQMPVEKTHIREVYMIHQSQWIGSLGGLLGMWIGLSIFTMAKYAIEALCWPLRQGKTRHQQSKTEPTPTVNKFVIASVQNVQTT